MKYFLIIFSIIIFSCSERKQKEESKNESLIKENEYPADIVRQGLEKQYDKTKWHLYCIHCDDTLMFDKSTGIEDKVTFASLDLKLESVEWFTDTVELNFYFYYLDSIKCDFRTIRNLKITTGAGYKKNNDSILYYISPTTANRFWEKGSHSRYQNPLQPEVVNYIRRSKKRLHPWFYMEVTKRKIIQ